MEANTIDSRDRRRRLLKLLLILMVVLTGPVLCSIYYLLYT